MSNYQRKGFHAVSRLSCHLVEECFTKSQMFSKSVYAGVKCAEFWAQKQAIYKSSQKIQFIQ